MIGHKVGEGRVLDLKHKVRDEEFCLVLCHKAVAVVTNNVIYTSN